MAKKYLDENGLSTLAAQVKLYSSATAKKAVNAADSSSSKTITGFDDTTGKATYGDIAIAASQVGSGELPIARGGTGASTAAGARTNLDVYSKSEVATLLNGKIVIVTELPSSGEEGKIYYLKTGSASGADNYDEYIWGKEPGASVSSWIKVGEHTLDLSGYKTKQSAVSDPTASGTGLTFIATASQNANGEMAVTKKTVQDGTTSQKGVVQLEDSHTSTSTTKAATPKNVKEAYDLAAGKQDPITFDGTYNASTNKAATVSTVTNATSGKADKVSGATNGNFAGLDGNGNLTDSGKKAADFATANHVHGNITNDGKIGSTAGLSVITGTDGFLRAIDLTTEAPTVPSSGTTEATEFISSVSQGGDGKLSAKKRRVPIASTSTAGLVLLAGSIGATVSTENHKAATEKAVRDAINALDVSAVGGAGKYIKSILEADGKISAVSETMDTTPTSGSNKAITSGAVYSALEALGGTVEIVTTSNTYAEVSALVAADKLPVLKITTSGVDEYYDFVKKDGSTSFVFEKVEGNVSKTYTCPASGSWSSSSKTLENSANKVTSVRAASSATDTAYPTEKAVRTELDSITNNSTPLVAGSNVNITSGNSGVTIAVPDGSTSGKGAVQLSDSVSDTSTTKAATANAVKQAYDAAQGAGSANVVVGASATATANAAATNGNVYINFKDSSGVKTGGSHKITGAGLVSVTSDANGNMTVTGSDPASIPDADITALFS